VVVCTRCATQDYYAQVGRLDLHECMLDGVVQMYVGHKMLSTAGMELCIVILSCTSCTHHHQQQRRQWIIVAVPTETKLGSTTFRFGSEHERKMSSIEGVYALYGEGSMHLHLDITWRALQFHEGPWVKHYGWRGWGTELAQGSKRPHP
jgi:hypothetical protein